MVRQVKYISGRLLETSSSVVGRKVKKEPRGRLTESEVKSKSKYYMYWDLLDMCCFEGEKINFSRRFYKFLAQ